MNVYARAVIEMPVRESASKSINTLKTLSSFVPKARIGASAFISIFILYINADALAGMAIPTRASVFDR